MSGLTRTQLTPAEHQAVCDWWHENDPDQTKFEYADNDRYAIKGNKVQEAAYDEIQHQGCCGYMDVEIKLQDGRTLLYGFNYGH